jgi:hypothetical protein
MWLVSKWIKKIRNLFHIPGEDVILIGLDDRNKSIRIYDLYIKTGQKFESKMESKVIEGNTAQVFLWYLRQKIDHVFTGAYDDNDPNIMHVQFDIDKRYGCIFKTEDKPEGIAYLVDMQSGQGAHLIPKQIALKRDPVIDMLVSINPYLFGSMIDSFIATELLRGRVEMWKTILIAAGVGVFCLIIGMGLK